MKNDKFEIQDGIITDLLKHVNNIDSVKRKGGVVSDDVSELVDLGKRKRSYDIIHPWAKKKYIHPTKRILLPEGFDRDVRYTSDEDYILLSKEETIKLGYEIFFIYEECLKSMSFHKINKPQKYVTRPIQPKFFYQCQFRHITKKGFKSNVLQLGVSDNKNNFPIFENNDFMKVAIQNGDFEQASLNLILFSSVIDNLTSIWSIEFNIEDECFILPADEIIIKEICNLRDNPISQKSGNRRPILHIVSRHLRRCYSGKVSNIKKHTRGIYNFKLDDFCISISPPIKEIIDTKSYSKFEKSFPMKIYTIIQENRASA